MNIFTFKQLMNKTDHFSTVISLISFISLSLIKRSLNSTRGWAIVNNSKITLPLKKFLKFFMARSRSIKIDPCYFSNTFLFLNQDFPENLRLNQMSFTVDSFSGDNQQSYFAPQELLSINFSISILIKVLASLQYVQFFLCSSVCQNLLRLNVYFVPEKFNIISFFSYTHVLINLGSHCAPES